MCLSIAIYLRKRERASLVHLVFSQQLFQRYNAAIRGMFQVIHRSKVVNILVSLI